MTNPFPNKKYKTIYCDPAWNHKGSGRIARGASRHYKLMKTQDIKNLPVQDIANDDCWLFMWVTNNLLKDGLDVMENWGFRYVTNLAWGKDRYGTGYYFRGQHELCLFGVKGNLKPKVKNESSFLYAKKYLHSSKPPEFYNKIENVSYEPRIELFARNTRQGWDSWGDQIFEQNSVKKVPLGSP